jgi:hypothetical protein
LLLESQGQVGYGLAPLLAYVRAYYYRLGERLGRFGDWRGGVE